MKKILIVFGTRPEALKLIPVITEAKKYGKDLKLILCSTGQHADMLDQVLNLYSIKPDLNLSIMKAGQTLTDITVNVLRTFENVLNKEKPDMVIVQGDTTTAMAAALSAFYHHIPVAHVEAGLRSGDNYQPFPEELNRKFISAIATLHFAPTEKAKHNLIKENIPEFYIFMTGNTVVDHLMMQHNRSGDVPQTDKRIILLTAHRRENLGEPLRNICLAVKELLRLHSDIEFVYPVHSNPKVQEVVQEILGQEKRVKLIKPQSYSEFTKLMETAYLILTDSGGVQEEAPYFHKPVLVLRDTTERPEGVEAGVSKLIGTKKETIVNETTTLLTDGKKYKEMIAAKNPYGDGKAAERIVKHIIEFLKA